MMRQDTVASMGKMLRIFAVASILMGLAMGQQTSPPSAPPPAGSAPAATSEDYSGMYTFLREGEFVQVTVEDASHVTGFISRYGDKDSDQGEFLNQFFKQAKLDGHNVSFTTVTVHGIWFEFKGTVDRGPAKTHAQEGYYVMKGTLIEYSTDEMKKVSAKTREVEFKLFPEDSSTAPEKHE
jgi:hypothetical protein